MQKTSLLCVCAKFICILGPGKLCSAMCSTVLIFHSPAHPTSPAVFLSSHENPGFPSESKPDEQEKVEEKTGVLHNQDGLRHQDTV